MKIRHFEIYFLPKEFCPTCIFLSERIPNNLPLHMSWADLGQEPGIGGAWVMSPHPICGEGWESHVCLAFVSVLSRLPGGRNSPKIRRFGGQRSKNSEKCLLHSLLFHITNILGVHTFVPEVLGYS